MSPFRRLFASLPPSCAIAGVLVALGACSSSDSSAPTVAGETDQHDNGAISIDEVKLSGTLEANSLKITIPISAMGVEGASGTLKVSVTDVQGKSVVSTSPVTYALQAGATSQATLEIAAPPGIKAQEDLVRFNLRLEGANGLRITRSLMYVVTPYEVRLEGPASFSKSKIASYRVRAENKNTKAPVAGVPVSLAVKTADGQANVLTGVSSAEGDAVFPVHLDSAGNYTLTASVPSALSTAASDSVRVEETGQRILLTSDKPLYQPGQTIHLRALALQRDGNKPVAAGDAVFEVEDGKGNKVFRKSVKTNEFGIAATTFTLGNLVNMGGYKLRATIGATKTEKTVDVSQYALPKFDVAVKSERAWYSPGDVVSGTVDARYFFGKLVAGGDVSIEAASLDVGQTVFQKVMGKLDAQGHYQFSLKLPGVLAGTVIEQGNATIALNVTVTDTAGQPVKKQISLPVSQDGITVALVPEATQIVPGVSNQLLLFVTDPLGNPIPDADVVLTPPTVGAIEGKTDAFGQFASPWAAPAEGGSFNFNVRVNVASRTISRQFSFGSQQGRVHLVVRTDKAVYQAGESVKVDVLASEDKRSIYIDWLNGGQTVDMRTLKGDHGAASFSMSIDGALVGSNRVEAYVVDDDGNIVRAGRNIFVRNASSLAVSLTTDKPMYSPGEPAKLTFAVKDDQGKPAVAALGVQVVDQAVFSLVDAHPGLLRSFFELEDTYSKPTYEIAPPSVDVNQLLFSADTDPGKAQATQKLTQAALAALGNHSMMGIEVSNWNGVVANSNTALTQDYTAAHDALVPVLKAVATVVAASVEKEGCKRDLYCEKKGDYFANLVAKGLGQSVRVYDYWGNAYKAADYALGFTTNGPDELSGTADDHMLSFTWDEVGLAASTRGKGGNLAINESPNNGGFGTTGGAATGATTVPSAGTGGSSGAGGAASGGPVDPTVDNSSGSDSPRVRQDFPETLYVNPAIITGPDGLASVDVAMADSITQWKVSSLANSIDGKLGGGESGVTVFQDFFVDVNFPATLTRGDQVSFPIAVYNYLNEPQSVEVSLEAGTWYTALGATSTTVALSPGQVTGVSFPVRVDQVGLRTLTVKAKGSTRSDAVARTVRVVPDGKQLSATSAGLLEPGTANAAFTFPTNAVPGSGQLFVEVYPAFLSQVVGGMDSMLRQPSGCFEQTTSTTWPNVLVTDYMQKTKQISPAIQLKAESLINAGYQRLLTFEHPGGGFSWFGTQDAKPFLSVTAFGLMEFADMAKVADIDLAMIERTRQWMLKQQQADGSWTGDMSEFFSFQTSALRNTAFVVWALAAGGYQGPAITNGVNFVKAGLAKGGADGYTLGIAANALQLTAPDDPATTQVMTALDAIKKVNGDTVSWDSGTTQTSFYGGGNDAAVTTTALVLQALLARGGNADVQGALRFLTKAKGADGNFGSTQATIWALRALLLAASKGSEGAVGSLVLSVDGQPAQTLSLTKEQGDVLTTVDLATFATAGAHQVSLSFAGTGKVSYNAVAQHNVPWSSVVEPPGPLTVGVTYDKTTLYVNDVVNATVQVRNNTASAQNMVMVTVGLPPGFEVVTDDLAQALKAHTLSKYEITGKQLMLYVSSLSAGQVQRFSYRLRATMPVKASDGGAEAHLYYEPEKKATAPASQVEAQAN